MPKTDEQQPKVPRVEFTRCDLGSVRDLRALIMEAAVHVPHAKHPVVINLVTPKISGATIDATWKQATQALKPEVAERLRYFVSAATRDYGSVVSPYGELIDVRIERPNYTLEVLRIVANATLSRSDGLTIKRITELVGASQSPVRRGLRILEEAGVIRGYECDVAGLTLELLGRIGAVPPSIRLRFKQGATPRPPHELLERARKATRAQPKWHRISISGAAAAMQDYPGLDLMGLPRLDLCLRTERHAAAVDLRMLENLSTQLEIEPNPTAPAPIVVSLPRASVDLTRNTVPGGTPLASPFDVYLSLMEAGLRAQSVKYAQHFVRASDKTEPVLAAEESQRLADALSAPFAPNTKLGRALARQKKVTTDQRTGLADTLAMPRLSVVGFDPPPAALESQPSDFDS